MKMLLDKIKQRMFWNASIRSITISYLETAIQFKQKLQLPAYPSFGLVAMLVTFFTFLVGYPINCFNWLFKNQDQLRKKEVQKKYGKLYEKVAVWRHRAIYYYPAFILRRFAFVMVPVIFPQLSGVQVMILVLIHSIYLIWYGTISPFISFKTTLIEGFNESLFMFLSYHLFVFTNYATGSFEEDVMQTRDNIERTVTVASFYMDETEVANIHWLEYLYYVQLDSSEEFYQSAIPDSTVWAKELAYNTPYVDHYLRYLLIQRILY